MKLRFWAITFLIVNVGFLLNAEKSEKASLRVLTLNAVGDVSLPVNSYNKEIKSQGIKLFDGVRPILDSGDLNFVNVEAAVSELNPTSRAKYAFTMPPERLRWLTDSGFNVISLANNHINDAGKQGIEDSVTELKSIAETNPIYWSGVSLDEKDRYLPVMIEKNGFKIALFCVGFEDSSAALESGSPVHQFHDPAYPAAIRKIAPEVDMVWVSSHFGKEYVHIPEAIAIAKYRSFIDAGANLVIGHHPHVIRGIEKYGEGVILHSLGNFSFASKTRRHKATGAKLYSMIAQIRFEESRITDVRVYPLHVDNLDLFRVGEESIPSAGFKPVPVKGILAEKVLNDLDEWTTAIDGNRARIVVEGDTGRVHWKSLPEAGSIFDLPAEEAR